MLTVLKRVHQGRGARRPRRGGAQTAGDHMRICRDHAAHRAWVVPRHGLTIPCSGVERQRPSVRRDSLQAHGVFVPKLNGIKGLRRWRDSCMKLPRPLTLNVITMKLRHLIPVATVFLAASSAQAGLINGSFEMPGYAPDSVNFPASIPGWQTTASGNIFEIWHNSFGGVNAYDGVQFAELNAYEVSTLYQDVSGIGAGSTVGWQFAHRGRAGVDVMRFVLTDLGVDGVIGGGDDTQLFSLQVSDGNTAWGYYTGGGITATGNNVRFSFVSVSAAGGATVGNFLDAADFGVGVGSVPEPGTLALAGLALLALGAGARRR